MPAKGAKLRFRQIGPMGFSRASRIVMLVHFNGRPSKFRLW